MEWLRKLFGGQAAPVARVDEQALALTVRQKLLPFRKGPSGEDEVFVDAYDFLLALKNRAAQSAALQLISSADAVAKAAKIHLRTQVMRGQLPFFYKDNGNKTVFVTDVYVPVRELAGHAVELLHLGQLSLADAYASALKDTDFDSRSLFELRNRRGLSYVEGKDIGKVFEMGADEDETGPVQPVLRIKGPGARPS